MQDSPALPGLDGGELLVPAEKTGGQAGVQGVTQVEAEFQPEQPDQRKVHHQKKCSQNRRCKEGDRVAVQVALSRAA